MKKIFVSALCSLMALFVFLPGTAFGAVNLIANPSLETAVQTLPQGWSQAKTGTNTTSFTYPLIGAQNGRRFAKITITKWTSGDAKWYFTPVSVTGGKQYYFRNYYKASVVANTYAEYTNAAGLKTVAALGQNPAKTAWTLSEYTITVPSDAVSMSVYQSLARIGTLQTDNYQLFEVPTVIITDNVPNASLEQQDTKGNPLAWSTEKTGTNTTAFTYATTGHTGSRSVTTTISRFTSGSAAWLYAAQPIGAGKYYKFTDYYKSNIVSTVSARVKTTSGLTVTVKLKDAPIAAAWTQYSDQFQVPANAATVTIVHAAAKKGYVTTDDYSLVEVPSTGTLSVKKVVVNTGGGVKTPADFSFAVNGASAVAFEADGQNDMTKNPGTYTIVETPVADYAVSYANCSNVVLVAGSAATCIITNTYIPATGTLTVNTVVIPATDTGKFNVLVDGAVKAANVGNNGTTGAVILPAGSHTISQTAGTGTVLAGYTSVIGGDCAADGTVVINQNDNKTCSITNTLIPTTGTLSVKKVVVNTGGGVKTPADFSFAVNGASAVAFEADGQNDLVLVAGTYTVTESADSAYLTAYDNCANVSLAVGATIICTITNTYITPSAVELIPNPSMETVSASSTLPLNWSTDSWGTGVSAAFTYETTGHSGNRSVTAALNACTAGSWCEARWYFDRVPTKAGMTYTFSEYYKSNVPTQIYVQFITTTGILDKTNIQLTSWANPLPAAAGWTLYTATFTAPANAIQFTILNTLDSQNGLGGWITIDDLSIMGPRDPGLNRGIVSLNFDDGFSNVYANAFPAMSAKSFKSTQFIISDCVTAAGGTCTTLDGASDLPIMTQAQMVAMYNAGHEIASHTKTHRRLSSITGANQATELSASKTALNALFPTVTNMATPYGDFNAEALANIKLNYRSHRTTAIGYNTHDYANPYYLQVQYVMPATTLAEFQGWLDKAKTDKSWLILLYHSVGDDTQSTGYEYNLTTSSFAAQMAAIQSGGLAVLTNEQALNEIIPQLAD